MGLCKVLKFNMVMFVNVIVVMSNNSSNIVMFGFEWLLGNVGLEINCGFEMCLVCI